MPPGYPAGSVHTHGERRLGVIEGGLAYHYIPVVSGYEHGIAQPGIHDEREALSHLGSLACFTVTSRSPERAAIHFSEMLMIFTSAINCPLVLGPVIGKYSLVRTKARTVVSPPFDLQTKAVQLARQKLDQRKHLGR